MSVIYGLYDPSIYGPPRIRYVGYTSKNPARRLLEHAFSAKNIQRNHREKWLHSLRSRNLQPAMLVLEEVAGDWIPRERFWITALSRMGLVNSTSGGEGLIDPAPEVRARISAKVSVAMMGNQHLLGHQHTDETKARIGAASKGRTHTIETRTKMSLAQMGNTKSLGCTRTLEHRAAISAALIGNRHFSGRTHKPETRAKMVEAQTGHRWITDGTQHTRIRPEDSIPSGWRVGMSPQSGTAVAVAARIQGSVWVTDGQQTRRLKADEPIPDGWTPGRLRKRGNT